jgi:hypothetical protein
MDDVHPRFPPSQAVDVFSHGEATLFRSISFELIV